MNRLRQKLKSESGASILIALLFFLICVLVAAVVLMASVTNAGKIKSNQKMHQKYLTVSSALELICDDLTGAGYYGQYSLTVKEHTDGTGTQTAKSYEHYYQQQKGQYDCQLSEVLIDELDAIFAKEMEADVHGYQSADNVKNYVSVFPHPETDNTTHTFVVESDGADGLEPESVQITVTLDRKSYTIDLTAKLVDDAASYSMVAELTPIATSFPHAAEQSATGSYQTEPMTWKLGWIAKAPEN